eukprot:Skav203551  [mRNA]  locus=scaffold3576:61843:62421:+ [translate_table: standard]
MSSGKPLTNEEMALFQELAARMQSSGGPAPSSGPVADSPVVGAMSDASKRLRDFVPAEDEEYDAVSWAFPTVSASHDFTPDFASDLSLGQQPIVPGSTPKEVKLPVGVASVEEWGQTLCQLPSLAKFKLSYKELTLDPQFETYLSWVLLNRDSKGPRVADLAKYLFASGYEGTEKGTITTYPDSGVVRKFKK